MPPDLVYTMVQKVKNDQKLKSRGGVLLSSELNTFPENVVIFFFAQIIIYHMLITGNKKFVGYLDEILHKSGVENGHSNEKIAEKTSLFSLLWLKARWTDA